MSYEKTNVLPRWFEEVWNQGREKAIDELAADGIVSHGLYDANGEQVSGKAKFKEFWRQFRSALPDMRIELNHALVDGDKEVAHCTVRGTHSGEGIGVPPCHRVVTFTGIVIGRIKDGQLAEVWDSWDFLGLYAQIGKLPAAFAK